MVPRLPWATEKKKKKTLGLRRKQNLPRVHAFTFHVFPGVLFEAVEIRLGNCTEALGEQGGSLVAAVCHV